MSDLGPLAPVAPPAATQPAAPVATPQQGNIQTPAGVPGAATPDAQTGQGGVGTQPQPQQSPPSPNTVLQGGGASQIADSASELSKGGQISAQVVVRDNNTLLVRTAAGNTLAISNLATALEQANVAVLNAALTLKLNPENPQQATVVSANGTALQPPLAATAQPPTAAQLAIAAAPPQPAGAATPALPQAGQTLTATVVAPPAGGNAALPAGSQLQVVVQSATLPPPVPTAPGATIPAAPVPQAATPSAIPVAPPAAAPATPSATPVAVPSVAVPTGAVPSAAVPNAATPTTISQPGVTSSVTGVLAQAQAAAQTPVTPQPVSSQSGAPQPALLQAPVPPAILQQAAGQAPPVVQPSNILSANVLAPNLAGQVITGTVTGQGQAGQVLVTTPQGVLSLALPQPLPPGTTLSFELAAIARPPMPAPTSVGPAPLAGVLTRLQGEWPALQQTLEAVRAADPALAQRLQAELLPQPNARLAATALQFMAAAAAGNAQAWLGRDAVRRLEQDGKGDLLKKLDDDFRELGRLNQRQGDNDWQALVMPMLIGGRVEPIQIFMRRRKDPKKQQKQTRFIIDFDLESTGPIQFDGFVSTRQLDLILRSESEFGPAFRLDVSAIFEEALAITGMTGSLRFHDREKPLPWPSPELDAKGPSTEVRA